MRNSACMGYAEDDVWDAGGMGCGELLYALMKRLRQMPGGTLKLIANDPGAAEDIPAWCRLTGNELLHHEDNVFWLRARRKPA
jgi:tRNA 2-thiouridine synthesizing protein A